MPTHLEFAKKVMRAAMARGIHLRGQQSRAGTLYSVEHVMVLPPFIVTRSQIEEIVQRLEEAIREAIQEVTVQV